MEKFKILNNMIYPALISLGLHFYVSNLNNFVEDRSGYKLLTLFMFFAFIVMFIIGLVGSVTSLFDKEKS